MKVLAFLCLCVSLSACTALDYLSSLAGGTTSKGHGNDNTLMLGSDVQQGIGNKQLTQEVNANHGEVVAGDKKTQQAQSMSNYHSVGLDVWQLILIVLLCLLVPSPFTPLYARFKRWLL